MKTKFKIKPHKLFAVSTLVLAVINLYLSMDIIRAGVIVLGIGALFLFISENTFEKEQMRVYCKLKSRECEDLKWSYQAMGRYIESMKIPELADLETRIENELRDIKVKQEFTAERLGISDEELEALRNEIEK